MRWEEMERQRQLRQEEQRRQQNQAYMDQAREQERMRQQDQENRRRYDDQQKLSREQMRTQRQQEEDTLRLQYMNQQAAYENQLAQEELERQRFQAEEQERAREWALRSRIEDKAIRRSIQPAGTFQPQESMQQAPTGISLDPLSKTEIKNIQILLKEVGFDPGPADGIMGPRTQQALNAFFRSRALLQGTVK